MSSLNPSPARSYAEAVERIQVLQALDTQPLDAHTSAAQNPKSYEVDPVSRSNWLTHGKKTPRAAVFLHGFTNSPKQFEELGQRFFERGYNVLIPRAPHHGLRDRLTDSFKDLSVDELKRYTTEAVDIAQGLGEQVSVIGLSMGGTLALWAAQNRADMALAAAIAPFLAIGFVPAGLTPPLLRLALLLPNVFFWKDPRIKNEPVPPLHSYPRMGTHAVANIFQIAVEVGRQAHNAPPRAGVVWMITNPSDKTVSNGTAQHLVDTWRAAGAQNIHTYAFEAQYNLPHDLIDPLKPGQQVDLVYPVLLDLLA